MNETADNSNPSWSQIRLGQESETNSEWMELDLHVFKSSDYTKYGKTAFILLNSGITVNSFSGGYFRKPVAWLIDVGLKFNKDQVQPVHILRNAIWEGPCYANL